METYFIGVLIFAVVLYLFSTVLAWYQKRIMNLVGLKTATAPQEVGPIVNSFLSRTLLSKRSRTLMMLEPAILLKDETRINEIIATLKTLKLNEFNKIGIYQKMLEYSVFQGDKDPAERYYAQLNEILSRPEFIKDLKYKSIKKEADQLIEIYIRKNIDYLPKILSSAEKVEDKAYKSIYYFRAAKLCYLNDQIENMKKYCVESKKYCKGSALETRIDSILFGHLDLMANE